MTPIKIPLAFIPDKIITLGYSGGMALYVANWESVLLFFEYTNVPQLAYETTNYHKYLN
jgi:hypothetical protein